MSSLFYASMNTDSGVRIDATADKVEDKLYMSVMFRSADKIIDIPMTREEVLKLRGILSDWDMEISVHSPIDWDMEKIVDDLSLKK